MPSAHEHMCHWHNVHWPHPLGSAPAQRRGPVPQTRPPKPHPLPFCPPPPETPAPKMGGEGAGTGRPVPPAHGPPPRQTRSTPPHHPMNIVPRSAANTRGPPSAVRRWSWRMGPAGSPRTPKRWLGCRSLGVWYGMDRALSPAPPGRCERWWRWLPLPTREANRTATGHSRSNG